MEKYATCPICSELLFEELADLTLRDCELETITCPGCGNELKVEVEITVKEHE